MHSTSKPWAVFGTNEQAESPNRNPVLIMQFSTAHEALNYAYHETNIGIRFHKNQAPIYFDYDNVWIENLAIPRANAGPGDIIVLCGSVKINPYMAHTINTSKTNDIYLYSIKDIKYIDNPSHEAIISKHIKRLTYHQTLSDINITIIYTIHYIAYFVKPIYTLKRGLMMQCYIHKPKAIYPNILIPHKKIPLYHQLDDIHTAVADTIRQNTRLTWRQRHADIRSLEYIITQDISDISKDTYTIPTP